MAQLLTERLLLRSLTLDDASTIEALAGDYEVAKSTLNIPHPYPEGSAKVFIESILDAEKDDRIAAFGILHKKSNLLIGIINLNLSEPFNRGELAYWIGKDFWGRGYGTEATKVLLDYGFDHLQLNRIFAASFTSNPGSWRIMEKAVLKYEGTLKQHVARFGQYHDLDYYGILREEFYGETFQDKRHEC